MEVFMNAPRGAENLHLNREAEAERLGFDPLHTPPERSGHYRGRYRWDGAKQIEIYLEAFLAGDTRSLSVAEADFASHMSGQLEDGSIPNQWHPHYIRKIDPEHRRRQGETKRHSHYGQPAMEGQVMVLFYHAKKHQPGISPEVAEHNARSFLSKYWDPLVKLYEFEAYNRTNGPGDYLAAIEQPEKSGRDSAIEFDHIKPERLQRSGHDTPIEVNFRNMIINFRARLALDEQVREANGDIEQMRQIFWDKDVEFNTILARNYYVMSELANLTDRPKEVRDRQGEYFADLARETEAQILKEYEPGRGNGQGMWHPEADGGRGRFYNLDKDGMPVESDATPSCVFPLLLPNISEAQLTSCLKILHQELVTRFGLAGVSIYSPLYDPGFAERGSIWRGPDWEDRKKFLGEGLVLQINRVLDGEFPHRPDLMQACKELLWHMGDTALEKLDMWEERGIPFPEFSHPETGKALRLLRVKHFTWPNSSFLIPRTTELNPTNVILLKHAKAAKAAKMAVRVQSNEDSLGEEAVA